MGNAEPASPRYATVDIKKVKASDSSPPHLDLVQQAIKGSGDGKVCVTSDDGNKAMIRAHRDDFSGDVEVPSAALKYEPVSPVGSRFHLVEPVNKLASEATSQERVAAGLPPTAPDGERPTLTIPAGNRAEIHEKQADGTTKVVETKMFGPDDYDKAKKWAISKAPLLIDRLTNSAPKTSPPPPTQ